MRRSIYARVVANAIAFPDQIEECLDTNALAKKALDKALNDRKTPQK